MSFASPLAISMALVMLVAAVDAAAVVKLEARASGRLQYCCTVTFADDTVLVALPDDGSTGVHEAQNTTLHAAGEFQSALSIPAIGGYSAVLGASDYPETGRHYSMIGGDYVLYQDELTVTSSTLATGTPITVPVLLRPRAQRCSTELGAHERLQQLRARQSDLHDECQLLPDG